EGGARSADPRAGADGAGGRVPLCGGSRLAVGGRSGSPTLESGELAADRRRAGGERVGDRRARGPDVAELGEDPLAVRAELGPRELELHRRSLRGPARTVGVAVVDQP